MSIELRFVCLLAAFVGFVLAAALKTSVRFTPDNRVRVIAGAAAAFVLPILWDALEAL
jgi:hypothetical protein